MKPKCGCHGAEQDLDDVDADADAGAGAVVVADADVDTNADPWLCLQSISMRYWIMTILQVKCE